MIIMTSSLSKCFSYIEFLRFEKRFGKIPFSWRISVDGRSNSRKYSYVFKFLRHSVDGTLVNLVSKKVAENIPTKKAQLL